MKSFLIPLLAAFTLPTAAVNAEILYLRCTPNSEQKNVDFTITINEANQSSMVSTPLNDGTEKLNKGSLFATSDLFIVKAPFFGSDSYQKFEISRLNGFYNRYLGSYKYPDQIPEKKSGKGGTCVKEERAKTLF